MRDTDTICDANYCALPATLHHWPKSVTDVSAVFLQHQLP